MNGVMFYLDRDVPLVHGHAHLHRLRVGADLDLAAAVLARLRPRAARRRAACGGSSRSTSRSGSGRAGAPARSRSCARRDEIFREVWGQLEDHLDGALDGVEVVDRFLDPAIEFPNPTGAANLEPLLVNTAGSWADRPDAVTRIPNLFLASDYVRTHTDLATMEGANEAARRAVNGILDATGSSAPRCEVWPLREPRAFAAARALDRVRWRLFHRPAKPPLRGLRGGRAARRPGPRAAALLRAPTLLRRPRLTERRPAAAQPCSSASSPNASTGPTAPTACGRSPAGGALGGPGDEAGGEVVRVGARDVDLGERLAGRVVGHRRRSTTGVPGVVPASGAPASETEPLARGLQHAAHAGHA